VRIESPADGTLTPWNAADVSGTVAGPERVGVLVNGIPAMVGLDANGRRVFFVDGLRLATGDTTITASALTIEGSEVSHSIRVNAAGARPPVRMSASPVTGGPPLAVTFEVEVDEGVSYAYPTIDFDGDGTVDATVTQRNATLSHIYSQPGLHLASLHSKSQNRPIVDEVGIRVMVENDLVSALLALWEEFRAALRARDADRALALVVMSSRPRASVLIGAINDRGIDPDLVYGAIQPLQIYDGFAEFEMVRTGPDGLPAGFPIQFARDADGIWRLKSF
jgi:PKD repeat protein